MGSGHVRINPKHGPAYLFLSKNNLRDAALSDAKKKIKKPPRGLGFPNMHEGDGADIKFFLTQGLNNQ